MLQEIFSWVPACLKNLRKGGSALAFSTYSSCDKLHEQNSTKNADSTPLMFTEQPVTALEIAQVCDAGLVPPRAEVPKKCFV
jgi:hypothetical protein